MGDVIGLGRQRPDGKKIVDLRKQQALKQEDLAQKGNISVRVLRDIERSNHPVPATTITAIATVLGATAAEITLSTPDEPPNPFATLLKLRTVRSATELNSLALSAHQYEWQLKVDPSEATAEDMRQAMTILDRLVSVRRFVERGFPLKGDEFDILPFGEIPRLARLKELLEKLRANGVNVLAGSYVRQSKEESEVVICVHFVPSEVEEEVITLDFDDLIPF